MGKLAKGVIWENENCYRYFEYCREKLNGETGKRGDLGE